MKWSYCSCLEEEVISCYIIGTTQCGPQNIESVLIDEMMVFEISFIALHDELNKDEYKQYRESYLYGTQRLYAGEQPDIREVHDKCTSTTYDIYYSAIEMLICCKYEIRTYISYSTHTHKQSPLHSGHIGEKTISALIDVDTDKYECPKTTKAYWYTNARYLSL